MYGNNYPNDYENKNMSGSSLDSTKTESGNFSSQNNSDYHTGYNTYNMGSGYGTRETYSAYTGMDQKPGKEKKAKKIGGYFKKALAAVSLGLFFGVCAGAGFYAVESATGMLGGLKETASGIAKTAEGLTESARDTIDSIGNGADTVNNTGTASAIVADVSQVVAEVMPAIVSINNTYTQTTMSFFGQPVQSEGTAAGSGIIVGESDTELLIVTNYHVVEGAEALSIQFVDGSEAEARLKGADSSIDLAVIAVSLENINDVTRDAIAVATLGDSDSLSVGEPAIAIGNSLGYGQSVTVGVISALDRVIALSDQGGSVAAGNGTAFIQTDAAINPGNSGGALLNMKGEVIGINSIKIGNSVIEGMGYAIPISAARPIIEDLMLRETREKVEEENKGYLGISQLTVVDEMAEAYGMPKGVYVSQVYEGTAAEAAGIVRGNIITRFDGNNISSSEDLLRVMEYYSEGDTVEIEIMQGSPTGWESKTVSLTLGGRFDDGGTKE